MTLSSLVTFLKESLCDEGMDETSLLIALCRDLEFELGTDGSWQEVSIVQIQVIDDDIFLIRNSVSGDEALSLAEALEQLEAMLPDRSESPILSCDNWEAVEDHESWAVRMNSPIIAAVRNPHSNMVGVMPMYDGWKQELNQ